MSKSYKPFKWLGSVPLTDPNGADIMLFKHAQELRKYGLTKEYGVKLITDSQGHHCYLVKYDQ